MKTIIDIPLTSIGDDYITVETSSMKIQKNISQINDNIYRPDMIPVDVRKGDVEHISIVSSQLNILRTVCPNFPYLYASSKSLAVYEDVESDRRLSYCELSETQQVSVLYQTLSALNLAHHLTLYSQDISVEDLRIYRRPYTNIQILDKLLETDVIVYIEPNQSSGVLYKYRYYTDLAFNTKRYPDIKHNVYVLLKSARIISPEKISPESAIQKLLKKYPLENSDDCSPESCFVEETSPHHFAFNQRTYTRLLNLYVTMPNTLTKTTLITLFKNIPERFSRRVSEFKIYSTTENQKDYDINNLYNKMKSHLERLTPKTLLRFIKDYSQVIYLYSRELSKSALKMEDYIPYFKLVSEIRNRVMESDDQDLVNIYVARFEL
jgi:hypothetical protein